MIFYRDYLPVYIQDKPNKNVENKTMITLDNLRSCDRCGNVFLKKMVDKVTNRCPACNVWKKELTS